jgi:epoxyqueuosine reductase
MDLSKIIKEKALAIGFDKVGITDTSPVSDGIRNFYHRWLNNGYNAGMEYLSRNTEKRLEPSKVFKGAKSIVSVAMNYNPGLIEEAGKKDTAFISRYALGKDYHRVIMGKLNVILDFIREVAGGGVRGRAYCDTAPIMERVIAQRAGIGWIGKNSALITEEFGSWVFLGEILLDIELTTDKPSKNLCSDCSLCLEACPSGAIVAPDVVDASRCFSYLTIENRWAIPLELRGLLENRVFGCDTCQEVCPFNNDVKKTKEPLFEPRKDLLSVSLEDFFFMAQKGFKKRFQNSAIKRAKREGLLRNIVVAMGNSGNRKNLPLLRKVLKEDKPIISEHARWARKKIEG